MYKEPADVSTHESRYETLNPDINWQRLCSFQSYFAIQTSYQTQAQHTKNFMSFNKATGYFRAQKVLKI